MGARPLASAPRGSPLRGESIKRDASFPHCRRYGFAVARVRVAPAPRVSIEGRRVRAETLIASAGACALVLSTTVPERGITVHSTYLGHDGAPTQVAHLLLGGGRVESEAHSRPHAELPVVHARRRCLYDHLQRLQDLVAELGLGRAAVDGLEQAVEAVEA